MRILITGASSGLGAEMAVQFAAAGHDLILAARRIDRLEALRVGLIARHPGQTVTVVPLDVCDSDAVFRTIRDSAPLDRVIVNAGIGGTSPVGTGGYQRNHVVAATNFLAALSQIEAAMEVFRDQQSGHLVVISSVAAVRGMRGGPAVYAATKRGLLHLAEGIRAETLGSNIDVTTVLPGYVRTEMTEGQNDAPFAVDVQPAVRAIVAGVDKRRPFVFAPRMPWAPLSIALRILPIQVVARIMRPPRGE